MSRPERRKEIDDLRKAGELAFERGKSVFSGPAGLDGIHWRRGWELAQMRAEDEKRDDQEDRFHALGELIDEAEDITDLRNAMRQLLDLVRETDTTSSNES